MFRTLIICATLATPAIADGIPTLPGYSNFRTPETTIVDQPMSYVQDWVMSFPEEGGNASLQVTAGFSDDGLLTVEVTENGVADDSVSAIQKRFDLRRTEDWRWELVAYGFRQKCGRRDMTGWQVDPCP
ncbi:hypothetical protein PGB28_07370 [Primorskyibacter aestuariivivens]|uniref:hypothetical protein n=1 Tax=Primorskyibacter aestuariivivens TaxID=1888912 RepID=UPI0023007F31|nr:hypothetical protein [Primorskyibacter aestuariivivens]MDA7428273.1 hypothetical protein [Primorskyibacter aestuariivivens]